MIKKAKANASHLASGLAILINLHISPNPAEFACAFELCNRALRLTCAAFEAFSLLANPPCSSMLSSSSSSRRAFSFSIKSCLSVSFAASRKCEVLLNGRNCATAGRHGDDRPDLEYERSLLVSGCELDLNDEDAGLGDA